jgi:glutathione peroxidase
MSRSLLTYLALTVVVWMPIQSLTGKEKQKVPDALNFKMKTLSGKEVSLSKYKGKVVLIVNVASECGLTTQYEQLQRLHETFANKGLAVLGFPCNQFGQQEPGTSKEIDQFCKKNYGVEFDLFEKVEVNGSNACPLFKHLTKTDTHPKGEGKVSWNFEKFLLDRNGKVVGRFDPQVSPDDPVLLKLIEKALSK